MKQIVLILGTAALLSGCSPEDSLTLESYPESESAIRFYGILTDTAILYTSYSDPGAYTRGTDDEGKYVPFPVETTGTVNTSQAGTYLITYRARSNAGNLIATVTRTVHVVQNRTAFLNGIYNAVCSCTAVSSSSILSVSSESYIASVTPASHNGYFELNTLKIGSEFATPYSSALINDSISLLYLSTTLSAAGISSGTLSPSKDSFTIDTRSVQSHPGEKQGTLYSCRNVFTSASIRDTFKELPDHP